MLSLKRFHQASEFHFAYHTDHTERIFFDSRLVDYFGLSHPIATNSVLYSYVNTFRISSVCRSIRHSVRCLGHCPTSSLCSKSPFFSAPRQVNVLVLLFSNPTHNARTSRPEWRFPKLKRIPILALSLLCNTNKACVYL